MMHDRRCRYSIILALAVGAPGCHDATTANSEFLSAAVAVPAAIHEVSLRTDEERSAWPVLPVSEGGASVTIRGFAFFGCGTAAVSAQRRSNHLGVAIRALNADRPCIATIPYWRPYQAELLDLPPGSYDMTVAAIGLAQRVASTVRLAP